MLREGKYLLIAGSARCGARKTSTSPPARSAKIKVKLVKDTNVR